MNARPHGLSQALILARYTLVEALKSRLGMVGLAVCAAGLGVAAFIDALALTDAAGIRNTVLAALLRASAVFLAATFVITAMVRDENDRGLELLLSLPLSRAAYLGGRWAGFALAGSLLALADTAVLLALGAGAPAVAWGLALMLELWIVVSLALACVLTFRHVVSALAAVAAFYILARIMTALIAVTASPVAPVDAWSFRLSAAMLRVLAALMPRLDLYAPSHWLGADAAPELAPLLLQTPVTIALLLLIAYVDLARRNR
ncbi:MAG: ABC transporter permease [Burkholderiales bacterium]|nr:ABC transporter permease [Burkholderiales bacterium]